MNAMNWVFLGPGVAEPFLVPFFFGASIVRCLFNILFHIIFWGGAPVHKTKKLPMNVTLMLKSVAKLFHIILVLTV